MHPYPDVTKGHILVDAQAMGARLNATLAVSDYQATLEEGQDVSMSFSSFHTALMLSESLKYTST